MFTNPHVKHHCWERSQYFQFFFSSLENFPIYYFPFSITESGSAVIGTPKGSSAGVQIRTKISRVILLAVEGLSPHHSSCVWSIFTQSIPPGCKKTSSSSLSTHENARRCLAILTVWDLETKGACLVHHQNFGPLFRILFLRKDKDGSPEPTPPPSSIATPSLCSLPGTLERFPRWAPAAPQQHECALSQWLMEFPWH